MLKLIRQYLRGAAIACAILAPLSMLVEVFMDLQQPAFMSNIIDIGVANGDLAYVLSTGGRMIGCALLGVLGGAGCSVLSSYASLRVGSALRESLFAKIQTLSFAEIDRLETSSLITRMTNDVSQVQNMVASILRMLVRSPMLCIGGIIMAFRLSPRLALILCVALPILFASALFIMKKAIPLYTHVQARLDGVNTVMRENLLGVRVVKAFTMESQQFARFEKANDALTGDSIRAQRTTFLLMPTVTLIMNLSVVAVLWFGGNMEISGSLPTGRIIAFVNYTVQISNALVMLVNFIMNVSRAQASAARIQAVLDTQPTILQPEAPRLPAVGEIAFAHVGFRYDTGGYVLRDLSFTIRPGERVGIIGATGCGKSTLVSLIPRLYDVTEGNIRIGGVDVREIPLDVLRQKVGIVMQNSLLFSGTVAENLRYGDEGATDETLWMAAQAAEAAAFLRERPEGLESPVEQRGRNFSGGQKQRLSIARTLLQAPEVLILDDATSAVDLATEARLHQAIRTLRGQATTLLIAQRIAAIMDCDTILVLEGGALLDQGRHEELMARCELYRSIAVSQLGEEVLQHV